MTWRGGSDSPVAVAILPQYCAKRQKEHAIEIDRLRHHFLQFHQIKDHKVILYYGIGVLSGCNAYYLECGLGNVKERNEVE